MTRTVDAATLAAAQAEAIMPIALVKMEFDSATVGFHTQLGDIVYDGTTYTGAGALGFIGPIEEDFDLTRTPMQIGLRGVPNDIIAIVLNEQFQGRPCTVYLGYLDATTRQLVGTPIAFPMTMDFPTMELGNDCQVTLRIEDDFALLEKPSERRYNNADQQNEYPGDRGFEYAEQAVEKQLYWGQKTPT